MANAELKLSQTKKATIQSRQLYSPVSLFDFTVLKQ